MLLLQSLDLHQRFLLGFVRHSGFFDFGTKLPGQCFLGRAFAQLFLDRPDLLPQEILPLLAIHPCLRFGRDLLTQIQHIQALLDHDREPPQTRHRIEKFQQLLPLRGSELGRKGDQIRQPARFFHAAHHGQHFFGHIGQERDIVLDLLQHRRHGSFGVTRGGWRIVAAHNPGHQVGFFLNDLLDFTSGDPLQDHMRGAARRRDPLSHLSNDPYRAEFELNPFTIVFRGPTAGFVPIGFGSEQIRQNRREFFLYRSTLRGVLHHALGEHQHLAQWHAQTAVDNQRRFLVFDGIRDRHVRQQHRLVHHQHR